MLFILLELLLVLLCVYELSVRRSRVWRMLSSQFPGETALPLIGNMLQLGTTSDDVHRNLRRIWNKYGRKNFRVTFGTDPMLYICNAEDIKLILGDNMEINKSHVHLNALSEHFGNSLPNSTGERWRTMRKILTPSFHFKLLDQYIDVANCEGNILIDKMRDHLDKPAFDFRNEIGLYSINVVCRACMGISVNPDLEADRKLITACSKILPLCIKRFYSAWYRHDFIYKRTALGREGQKIVHDTKSTLDRIMEYRRKEFEKNIKPMVTSTTDIVNFISSNRTRLTFVDIMLLSKMPDGSPIPDEFIREETHVMVFAGHDTSLCSLSFTLSALAKYKELQYKVYEEQLEIFGEDLTKDATAQDLNKMKFLRRFIQETMRIYPIVGGFGRHITKDLVLHDGRVVPSGTNVTFYIPGLHMNPKYFPDPEKFDPDRFLKPVSTYTYLPFSTGPRNCIGFNFAWMTMRCVLSKIVRNFELSLESPDDEPQPVNEFILTSRNGHKIKLTERRKREI